MAYKSKQGNSFKSINWLVKKSLSYFSNLEFVKNKLDKNTIAKTIKLYEGEGFISLFSKLRFWDGPMIEIEQAVPKSGVIVDVGSGEGILSNFLAISSPRRKVIGLELEKHRIKVANRGVKNTKFVQADALRKNFPSKPKGIVMSHMLHHLPGFSYQVDLLKKVSKTMDKKSTLVIAEVDKGFTLKYILAWATDAIIVPILFEGTFINLNFFHRSKTEWVSLLKELGFRVKVRNPIPGRPFPDIIIIASKK